MADTNTEPEVEFVHVRGESGQVIKMDLPLPEHIAQRVLKGHLRVVNADGQPIPLTFALTEDDRAEDQGSDLTKGVTPRPAANAVKAEWIGYAVRAHGMDPEVAEGMTKQDLIDAFGNF